MKNIQTRNTLILTGIALFAIFVPFLLIKAALINAYTAYVITLAGINAIMALSVNVVSGITGQLTLGQCAFEAVGAYMTMILAQDVGLPLPVAMIIAPLVAAFLGFLIGFPTLKLEGDYLAIVTLAFGEIIRVVLVNLKGITGGPNGKSFKYSLLRDSLDWGASLSYLVIIAALVLIIVFLQNFLRSSYGRAIMAVREDEIAANSNGVSVFKYKMIGFVVGSFIGGIGGALYAPFIGLIKPELASFNNSINALIFVVLGGMGSITGSVIAAFVLTYLQEFLRFLQNYRLLFYPVILMLVMQFRPQGLLGTKEFSFIKTWEGLPECKSKIAVFLSAKFNGKKSGKPTKKETEGGEK